MIHPEIKSLYKYKPINQFTLDIIANDRIFYPLPGSFNDPFDTKCSFKNKSALTQTADEKKIAQAFPDENPSDITVFTRTDLTQEIDVFKNRLNNFGILSLTGNAKNILMWSHYADSHRGVCLIFDTSDDTNIFGQAIKVQYQHEYPVINIMDLNNHNNTINMISVKSIDWGYEKEWRIIRGISVGGDGYFDIEPKSLTGIILGSHITEKDEKRVMGWTSKYPTSLNVFTSKIDSRQYKVNIVPNEGTVVKVK